MGRLRFVVLVGIAGVFLGSAAPAVAGSSPRIVFTAVPSTTAISSFAFPSVGQLTQTFRLTNTGGSATSALKVTLTAAQSGFVKTSDTCTQPVAISLGPGKSCQVTIGYRRVLSNASDSASVVVKSSKPTVTWALGLSGQTGTCTVTNESNWTRAATLQDANDGASDGDLVGVSGDCAGTTDITHNLTIDGVGTTPTLDAQRQGDTVTNDATAKIAGLTITGGSDDADPGGSRYWGGGIKNRGDLTLDGVTVTDNHTQDRGGGIQNYGTLSATDTTISDNSTCRGAGIENEGGSVALTDSQVTGNSACSQGGGIACDGGSLTLSNTDVTGNSVSDFGLGGGGLFAAFGCSTTLNGTSLISSNSAPNGAGAYLVQQGDFTDAGPLVLNDSSQVITNTPDDIAYGPLF